MRSLRCRLDHWGKENQASSSTSQSPLVADKGNRFPVLLSGHWTNGSQPVLWARLTATSSSVSSSLPSSPLPLSYSCSQFHNPVYHSLDIWQLVAVCPSLPCLGPAAVPFMERPACWALLLPPSSISSRGLRSAHSALSRSAAGGPSHCGNQGRNDSTPQVMLAGANLLINIVIFNKLEISLPKYTLETSQVK